MLASAFASTNLVTRTLVIWKHKWFIVYPLILASIAQFIFYLYVGAIKTVGYWVEKDRNCIIRFKSNELSASTLVYTSGYDFIILVLTILGISKTLSMSEKWNVLYHQGIIYFVFTCMINVPAMIFFLLQLNPAMSAMFAMPASAISSILSCRAVVGLMGVNFDGSTTSGGTSLPRRRRSSADPVLSSHMAFPSAVYGTPSVSDCADLSDPETQASSTAEMAASLVELKAGQSSPTLVV